MTLNEMYLTICYNTFVPPPGGVKGDKIMDMNIKIQGIHCAGCINSINSKLQGLGVIRFDLDLYTKIAEVIFDEEELNKEEIIHAINQLGYDAQEVV
jgi:copper chaperone CopZ